MASMGVSRARNRRRSRGRYCPAAWTSSLALTPTWSSPSRTSSATALRGPMTSTWPTRSATSSRISDGATPTAGWSPTYTSKRRARASRLPGSATCPCTCSVRPSSHRFATGSSRYPGSEPHTDTSITAADQERMNQVWDELRKAALQTRRGHQPLDPAELGLLTLPRLQSFEQPACLVACLDHARIRSNSPIEAEALAEFFARCGWQERDAAAKLEWALAASDEWVVCKLDEQLSGSGRSCRLGPVKRVVFDVVVDPRFEGTGMRGTIVRLLTENAGGIEEVSVFSDQQARPFGIPSAPGDDAEPGYPPAVSRRAYLGKQRTSSGGQE